MSVVAVLRALGDGHRYGFDIMDATGLPGGTVYPVLARLEHDGRVRSNWENVEAARAQKRPPRRYYDLSASGRALLDEQLSWLRDFAAAGNAARGRS